jgi:thioredoxin reductase
MDTEYDVIVVGGGAAGASGAKIAARMRRRVLVVDAGAPRNAPAEGVHNYLYAEGFAPATLRQRASGEMAAYGVDVVEGSALGARVLDDPAPGTPRFTVDVRAADGARRTVGARRLLLATGLVDELPAVEGLAERWGRDVLHCPFCHGWEVRDQAVGVLGSTPLAVHQVLLFRGLSDDVVYFQHTAPDPSDEQVEQLAALGVTWVVGRVAAVETTDGALSGVRMADGRVIPRQALATGTTVAGREDLVADLGLAMSDLEVGGAVLGRYLPADATGATATPGVWAAGNVAAPVAQVVTAAAAGATAGSAIHGDLLVEDVAVAVAAYRARTGAGTGSTGGVPATDWWDHREARWVRSAGNGAAAAGAGGASG